MEADFLQEIQHLGFTARIKRLNEKIVSSTLEHYSGLNMGIEPNWHVIFLLLKEKGKLTVTEIASALGFSHPAMIKITRKMKDSGYLESFKDPDDGRKTFIQLSKQGSDSLPAFEEEWNRVQLVLKEFVSDVFLENLNQLEQDFDTVGFKERYQKRFGKNRYTIRNAKPSEFKAIGALMVEVYAGLEGFPRANEQPQYYETLANIGDMTQKPGVDLLIAVSDDGKILGALLYFEDMQQYGSGGIATKEKNASGFRFLAVDPSARGLGIGKALSIACIEKARKKGHTQLIIHSTAYMKVAWKMYEKLGFVGSTDLNFKQGDLQVYGFRLKL
ncbi:GNAT family N-acetyltransferase [Flagellimonas iocasae]|uniref:GNAT family N-acetyltransferase n=1 Tax=Flagellimonas iocasae TaxID=2055905 RepID=A0ABW4XS74_9FLAO